MNAPTINPAVRQVLAMAEAVGFLPHTRPDGSVLLARPGVPSIPVYASKRNWGADALAALTRKILRYGDPVLVARWQRQERRAHIPAAKHALRSAELTAPIEVPEHLRAAVQLVANPPDPDPARPPAPQEPPMPAPTGETVPTEPDAVPTDPTDRTDLPEQRGEPVNMATLIRYFRAHPHQMVILDDLAEHFGKHPGTVRNAIRQAINRSLTFRASILVHAPGSCWEWVEEGAPARGQAPPAEPAEPAEPAAPAAPVQSVDLAQAKQRIAALEQANHDFAESLRGEVAKRRGLEQSCAELRARLERIAEAAMEALG